MNPLFRPILKDEIPAFWERLQRALPWIAEPHWNNVIVKVDNGRIVAMYGIQVRYHLEPVWGATAIDTRDAFVHADAKLLQAGIARYEAFIPNINKAFQKFVERHLGVTGVEELPGKIYFFDREVCHWKIEQPEASRSDAASASTAEPSADAEGLCATRSGV